MKRICLAVTNDLSFDQRMHRICRTLTAAGYHVTLIGRQLPESPPIGEMPFHCIRMSCLFRRGAAFYAEYNLRLFFRLLLTRHEISVSCDLDTALAVVLSARMCSRRCVHDAHEMFGEVPELVNRKRVKAIWRWIGNITVRRFDARYTVGPAIAEALRARYRVPFGVVRNVPPSSREPILPISQREPVILYQGALNAGRGLECAIDAMHQIEGYTLVLVGEGDLSQELRHRVTAANLESKVRFVGRVEPAALSAYTRSAMIGINLLENSSLSYYYSLANKFFDYMHAGTPSVNMAFPEYQKIIDRHRVGICLASLEVNTYVAQVRNVLDNPAALDEMHTAAREASLSYCWEREKPTLLGIYSELEGA